MKTSTVFIVRGWNTVSFTSFNSDISSAGIILFIVPPEMLSVSIGKVSTLPNASFFIVIMNKTETILRLQGGLVRKNCGMRLET